MEETEQGVQQDFSALCPRFMPSRKAAKETNLPEHVIRMGIKEGWVPGFPRGNRFYVNVDQLIAYLKSVGSADRR